MVLGRAVLQDLLWAQVDLDGTIGALQVQLQVVLGGQSEGSAGAQSPAHIPKLSQNVPTWKGLTRITKSIPWSYTAPPNPKTHGETPTLLRARQQHPWDPGLGQYGSNPAPTPFPDPMHTSLRSGTSSCVSGGAFTAITVCSWKLLMARRSW